jgi:hypothetical protein
MQHGYRADDEEKDDCRQDDEIDYRVNENAVVDRYRPGFLGRR